MSDPGKTIEPQSNMVIRNTQVNTHHQDNLRHISVHDANKWTLVHTNSQQSEYTNSTGAIRIIDEVKSQIREYHPIKNESGYTRIIFS